MRQSGTSLDVPAHFRFKTELCAPMVHEGRVLGFVTAISDGVLSAFIPLLEVLPERQGQGIGSELVRRILGELEDFYMVDLVCDPELEGFYRRFEMTLLAGMAVRRRHLLTAH